MIKILTLRESYDLYLLLKDHMPSKVNEIESVNFVGTIVHSIRESEEPENYAKAIEVFTGEDFSTIAENYNPTEVLELFITGLMENNIILISEFFSKMGF